MCTRNEYLVAAPNLLGDGKLHGTFAGWPACNEVAQKEMASQIGSKVFRLDGCTFTRSVGGNLVFKAMTNVKLSRVLFAAVSNRRLGKVAD